MSTSCKFSDFRAIIKVENKFIPFMVLENLNNTYI